jgi:hypothetical protein
MKLALAALAAAAVDVADASEDGDGDDDDDCDEQNREMYWMMEEVLGLVHYASFLRRFVLIWIISIVIICAIK